MTTQNPINLDTPDDHPFLEWVESEWIGTGKKYPISGEVPAFIEAARSRALAVPSVYIIRGQCEPFLRPDGHRTKIGCFRDLMAPNLGFFEA